MGKATTKKGWTKVKFGEVVRLATDRSKDPLADGIERYVGLEHIDPEDLRIRRWGLVADGTTFTSKFRPGHVLFGKRRAYLRKVAVADFEGVCSGDIYVFEPKNNNLLPELLPFLCQTDAFFDHAISTSDGSLSPRTNWRSLADFEFALPPLEDQGRIARVLMTSDCCANSYISLVESLHNLKNSVLMKLFQDERWQQVKLSDVTTRISVGLAISVTKYYRESGVPILRNMNIRPSGLDDTDLLYLDKRFADRHSSKKVKTGDVLTTRTGANIGQTCLVPEKYDGVHTFTTLVTTCDKTKLVPEYLAAHMNSLLGQREVERLSTSGGKNNLNVTVLCNYQINLPPLEEQRRSMTIVQNLDEAIKKTVEKAKKQKSITSDFIRNLAKA